MKPKTVLLVNTNRMRPPVGPLALDYIGTALRAAGHKVRLLDLCLAPDPAEAASRAFAGERPDLAALTFRNTDDCYFASRQSFVDVLRGDVALLRQHYDGPIVVGGGGFSLMPVPLLEHAGADYGVCGDGEAALPALVRALAGESALEQVPGLVWRQQGRWRRNPRAAPALGAGSLAARDLVDNEAYFREGGQAGIETKRGCPGLCVYCADPAIKGAASRLRPPADVAAELRNLRARGIDHFHLCDSEFNLPIEHARAVCAAISAASIGDRIRWYTYACPAPFPAELVAAMRRAGCAGVNFGVDSATDSVLARLGRRFRAAHLAETARVCREAGMVFMFDLLLGGPGETPETIRETLAAMKRLAPDRVGISLGVRVYPGTPLARGLADGTVERHGLQGDPDGLEPAFFLSPALGGGADALLHELIGRDERFFLPSGGDAQDYNYNANAVLQAAIRAGHRGAYWDILRRLANPTEPASN